MLDFRKTLLTFAAVGLVFAGAANAQVATLSTLTATGGTGYVAVEGTTEALPQVVVGFTANTLVSSATLVLTSNVPFTTGTKSDGTLDVTVSADFRNHEYSYNGHAERYDTLTGRSFGLEYCCLTGLHHH